MVECVLRRSWRCWLSLVLAFGAIACTPADPELESDFSGKLSGPMFDGQTSKQINITSESMIFTSPGINSACAPSGASNHTAITGKNLTSTYANRVTSDDTANSSDASGLQAYASISFLGWMKFDNAFRQWGRDDGLGFPTSVTGVCESGNCRIFDWRIKNTDTAIYNRSDDGVNANGAFTSGATCPAAVHGNEAISDQQTTVNTFLLNAREVFADAIGDNDGLCESNEACIYSPNIGVYQGEGDYTVQSCIFQNGTVSGVTMFAYPQFGM